MALASSVISFPRFYSAIARFSNTGDQELGQKLKTAICGSHEDTVNKGVLLVDGVHYLSPLLFDANDRGLGTYLYQNMFPSLSLR